MFLIKVMSSLLILTTTCFAANSTITVDVKGMVCSFCAQGITKKFKSESAVSSVDVSLEKKFVKLVIEEGQNMPDEKIGLILKDAGFTVEKISRDQK